MAKVAVIGCGPSGMFFLHALAFRRKRLEEDGDTAAIANLPDVTCFERSASPGGLWRSDRNNAAVNAQEETKGHVISETAATNKMYEGLWTNASKEAIEFFDYTFDEHFGRAMPAYMPRQLILEYMLARCTKDNPNLFNDVKFNTAVKSVTFNEDVGQFHIQTVSASGSITEDLFDKCIWAAGTNGIPKIPEDTSEVLSAGGYKGAAVHSSKSGSNFDLLVRGKKILLIGDSYSAEDLTLQAIKLGVRSVDIISRSGVGICVHTGSWPSDCVHVYMEYKLTSVTDNGRGVVVTSEEKEVILNDIETVIFCTGYSTNMKMLDPALLPATKWICPEGYEIPKDWKMPTSNMSEMFGDIPVGEEIWAPGYVHHDVYRGQLMKNPNMMYFLIRTETPLLDLDVQAWLLLAQITGDLPLPSQDEMKQFNLLTLLEGFRNPETRQAIDTNYWERYRSFASDHADYWSDHWSYNWSDERVKQNTKDQLDFQYRLLARDMQDAMYPHQIGTFNKLNKKGNAFVDFEIGGDDARCSLDAESTGAFWRTFRDEKNPSKYYSLMTGTRAAPLKCRWMDLDGCSIDEIVDTIQHFETNASSPFSEDTKTTSQRSDSPGSVAKLRDVAVVTQNDFIRS